MSPVSIRKRSSSLLSSQSSPRKSTSKRAEAKEKEEYEKIVQMFSHDLQQAMRTQRGGNSSTKRGVKISRYLQMKIGEATNLYAFGKLQEAIVLFEEVIKERPDLPDVTHTMSLIYQEKGDLERSFKFAFLSAWDTRTDSEKWQ